MCCCFSTAAANSFHFTQEKEDEEEKETKDGTEDKETADASCLSEVQVVNRQTYVNLHGIDPLESLSRDENATIWYVAQ